MCVYSSGKEMGGHVDYSLAYLIFIYGHKIFATFLLFYLSISIEMYMLCVEH